MPSPRRQAPVTPISPVKVAMPGVKTSQTIFNNKLDMRTDALLSVECGGASSIVFQLLSEKLCEQQPSMVVLAQRSHCDSSGGRHTARSCANNSHPWLCSNSDHAMTPAAVPVMPTVVPVAPPPLPIHPISMDRVESNGSDLDLDIDLESGGTTSEDDEIKVQHLSCEYSKNLLGGISSRNTILESPYSSRITTDCSCSYDKLLNSDEISIKNKEMQLGEFKEQTVNYVSKTMDKGKPKKKNSIRPPKPPRPPGGPSSLHASDIKLLKEISELNLKRKRMERIRTLKKTKKEKATLNSTFCPCLISSIGENVTIFPSSSSNALCLILDDRRFILSDKRNLNIAFQACAVTSGLQQLRIMG
ncbi:hypothetical protein BUALT_Bualt15G0111300 [Buddleja alternifolia]|uniref:Uncharacterized protein n=1 Tax=Buddleja alternifolia TaxID=168488 RepID=A0AAV6WFT8_9LAMI|nr:hypothetical protein BUALT_Bualt15G0111300 [Buddleja alternifolia]